jgi:hypothetical protein
MVRAGRGVAVRLAVGVEVPARAREIGGAAIAFLVTWKPCGPGLRPVTSAITKSLRPSCTNTTLPATLLPADGASVALTWLCAPAAAAARSNATASADRVI